MSTIRDHLGVHAQALMLREQRGGVLASNIAHAATPGYKARDLDFSAALAAQTGTAPLKTSHGAHFSTASAAQPGLAYRQPLSPALDGNTVELSVEQMQFAENSMRYQASLTFLNRKISGLTAAIKGE